MARSVPGPRWETPIPPEAVGTYGKAVRSWARRRLGITFGRWQAHAIDAALRHDRNGDLLARIALLSTARQCGKSVIVRALVGWMLDEGRHLAPFAGWTAILAAAHDAKQARLIYGNVWQDFLALELQGVKVSEWRGIRAGHLAFDTVTGQPGSVRGWSAGLVAWDEMLTQRDWDMWEALSPTQSAQRSPLMLLTSTAGRADSVVLRAFYDRLRRICAGEEPPDSTFYGAWWASEDPDAGLDWKQIRQANPALGDGRLTRAAIRSEYGILPADSWRRERLNHFVDTRVDSAFNPHVWAGVRQPEPLAGLTGPYVMGVDVQPGWERASVCVAGVRLDGRIGVEVFRDLRDITADDVIAAVESFPDIDLVQAIVYDSQAGGASAFERHADATASPWQPLKPSDVVAACMDVTEMILSGRLAVDDPLIDSQIPVTGRRPVGMEGAFRFSRHASAGAIDGVMAMTFAAHGIVSVPGMPRIT
jgi:hypothetical protein